ncbi:MAG: AEC family transporter [Terrimicrobiaceae bacterium]|nr:AEC family transporter [Terrimicrobiaceae bacterium]
MEILFILAPVLLLVGVGAGMRAVGFLDPGFISALNKLTFRIALPALVFRSAQHAGIPPTAIWPILGVVLSATLVTLFAAWVVARFVAGGSKPTFIGCSFFGNIAYISIPVLAHAWGPDSVGDRPELLASAAVSMVLAVVVNNFLATLVFQPNALHSFGAAGKVFLNPLVISGLAGIAAGIAGVHLHPVLESTVRSLGAMGVPLALLCVGGSLDLRPLAGRWGAVSAVCVLKVLFFPAIAWAAGGTAGLSAGDLRIALVFAACPTAVVAYTMASQSHGDEPMAAACIALTTLVSFVSLAVALAVTG